MEKLVNRPDTSDCFTDFKRGASRRITAPSYLDDVLKPETDNGVVFIFGYFETWLYCDLVGSLITSVRPD